MMAEGTHYNPNCGCKNCKMITRNNMTQDNKYKIEKIGIDYGYTMEIKQCPECLANYTGEHTCDELMKGLKGYSDLSEADQKKIISKSAKESNEEQKKLVDEYEFQSVIRDFSDEFGYKTRDGVLLPISQDPDVKLKEKFIIFLLSALTKQESDHEEEKDFIANSYKAIISELKADHKRELKEVKENIINKIKDFHEEQPYNFEHPNFDGYVKDWETRESLLDDIEAELTK
jgi:hypothetical protein